MLCRNHSGSINQSSLLNVIFSLGPSLYVTLLYFGWFLSSTVPMLGCSPVERWCQQCRKQLLGFNQSHPLFFLLLHFLSFSHLFRLHSSLFHFLLAVNMDIKWMERVNQIISPCLNHHHLNSPRLDFPQQKASLPSVFLPIPVYWSSRPQPLLKAHLTARSRRSTWENLSC